jgi:hypothetical protein
MCSSTCTFFKSSYQSLIINVKNETARICSFSDDIKLHILSVSVLYGVVLLLNCIMTSNALWGLFLRASSL